LSGFHVVRTIGVSLLASAGILGIVFGIAAQKSIGGLVAGIQLAVTQQLRIGDTVIVDTERGTVEEIHLTFVVLRLWDLRRLIVPATHFLEQSFQNWTRVRTHLLGTVELWVDYAAPLAPLRAELALACKTSKLWDGKTCLLQVTDASDKALKIRMLVSAEGSGHLFDLRCEVRERVVELLQSLGGGIYLPHDRSSSLPDLPEPPRTIITEPVAERETHAAIIA
jgi:small-conductance mechanosensitive channel